jgi:hypothetical protein
MPPSTWVEVADVRIARISVYVDDIRTWRIEVVYAQHCVTNRD